MAIVFSRGGNVMSKLIFGLAAATALFLGTAGSAQAQHPLHPHHHHRNSGYSTNYGTGRLYVSPYSRYQGPVYIGGYGGYSGLGVTTYYGGGYNSGYRYNSYRPTYGYGGAQLDPHHTYHQFPYPHVHHNHW